jgi:hypothetical protein
MDLPEAWKSISCYCLNSLIPPRFLIYCFFHSSSLSGCYHQYMSIGVNSFYPFLRPTCCLWNQLIPFGVERIMQAPPVDIVGYAAFQIS